MNALAFRSRGCVAGVLALALAACATAPSGHVVQPGPTPLESRLAAPIADFSISEEPLGKALDRLSAAANVKINVNWPKLAEDGVTPDKPVSLSVKQVPARRILWLLLDLSSTNIGYWLDGDTVQVGAANALPDVRQPLVRVYDVRDLLGWRPGTPAPVPEQPRRFADSVPVPFGDYYRADPNEFVETVRLGITPQKWVELGGDTRVLITEYRGLLIVSADETCQREVAELIGQMRAAVLGRQPRVERSPQ